MVDLQPVEGQTSSSCGGQGRTLCIYDMHSCEYLCHSEWPAFDPSQIFFISSHVFILQDNSWVFGAYDKVPAASRTVLLSSSLANRLSYGTLSVHIDVNRYLIFSLVITEFLF